MFWEICLALEIFYNNIADWGPVNSLKRAPAQAYSYELTKFLKTVIVEHLRVATFLLLKVYY